LDGPNEINGMVATRPIPHGHAFEILNL